MTRLDVTKVSSTKDRTLPIFAEIDEIGDRIRNRAYEIFSGRGFGGGLALDDWLTAERQVCWPTAELQEDDDIYKIKVALAGFTPDEISVTATPREMIVKAEHESETREGDAISITYWSDFRGDKVCRCFRLPSKVDVDEIVARYKDGMLDIEARKLPLAEEEPKDIEISTAA